MTHLVAPTPNGHYSQAVVANGFLFLSMQLPIQAGSQPMIPPAMEDQVLQALRNCSAVLESFGSALDLVACATIYLTNMDDWPAVDRIFARFFGSHRPARAMIGVGALHLGARTAVQMVATLPSAAGLVPPDSRR